MQEALIASRIFLSNDVYAACCSARLLFTKTEIARAAAAKAMATK